MEVKNRLKEARLNANLSQVEVKDKTGINNKSLSNWEKGVSYPSFKDLLILSDLYQVTTDYLLGKSTRITKQTPTSKYTWLHGLVEDVLQDEPAVLAVLESSTPYVAGSVGGAAKDVLRSSLRLVTDSMASYDTSPGVLIRGGNEYTKNNFTRNHQAQRS
ncbi:helix-turn-helix transcriptional regulator [Anaerovibrio slackiae]|uniref:helix-turn-helix transcriptional regulator n=1 Tax=Anaerovibrio slackiae TaxID=2652309 RepID=UPI003868C0CA